MAGWRVRCGALVKKFSEFHGNARAAQAGSPHEADTIRSIEWAQMMLKENESSKPRKHKVFAAGASSSNLHRIPTIGLGRLLREADLSFNRALRGELSKHGVTFSQYQTSMAALA
jgi:hypothetical protein